VLTALGGDHVTRGEIYPPTLTLIETASQASREAMDDAAGKDALL